MKIGHWNRFFLCSPKTFFAYLVIFDNPSAHKSGERDHSGWLCALRQNKTNPSKVLQRGDNLSRDLLEISPLFSDDVMMNLNTLEYWKKNGLWVAYMGIILFFFSIGILNSPIFFWGGQFPRISLYNQYKRDEIYRISVLARHWTIPWRWQVDGSRGSFVASFGVFRRWKPAPHPWKLSGSVESILNFYQLGLIY